MRNLIGTLIGKTDDLADEVFRARSIEVELTPRGPGLRRIEDLLRRALQRLGDSEFLDDYDADHQEDFRPPKPPPAPPSVKGSEYGSWYKGSDGVHSADWERKARTPPNSFTDSYTARRQRRSPAIRRSLIEGSIPEEEFDSEAERFAMEDLPPGTPPPEHMIGRSRVPPHIASRFPRQQPQEQEQEPEEYEDEPEYEESVITEPLRSPTPEQIPRSPEDIRPLPYRPVTMEDEVSDYSEGEDLPPRPPTRSQAPPPEPIDLPTPVRSGEGLPEQPTGPHMRPPYPAGGMPPPPPGMGNMPRPMLPRIAGVRDPISTT